VADWGSRAIWESQAMAFSRRTFFWTAGGLLALSGATAAYARFVEPKWLDVTETEIQLPKMPIGKGVKLLHLSDFHASPEVPYSQIETAIRLGLERQPDLACLTGDFITSRIRRIDQYLRLLRLLTDQVPTFACFGNHDRVNLSDGFKRFQDNRQVGQLLDQSGIQLLFNQHQSITVQGTPIEIVGVGDYLCRACRPESAFTGLNSSDRVVILLSHNPDSKQMLDPYHWDLMLCGHTHGGQLKIPFFGHRPFLSVAVTDQTLAEGLYPWKPAINQLTERYIFITRGVGNLMGARFNCRPEVSLLNLESTRLHQQVE
jgi:hypothetical protein